MDRWCSSSELCRLRAVSAFWWWIIFKCPPFAIRNINTVYNFSIPNLSIGEKRSWSVREREREISRERETEELVRRTQSELPLHSSGSICLQNPNWWREKSIIGRGIHSLFMYKTWTKLFYARFLLMRLLLANRLIYQFFVFHRLVVVIVVSFHRQKKKKQLDVASKEEKNRAKELQNVRLCEEHRVPTI